MKRGRDPKAQGFTGSVPALWEVTSPELALVRLHGRNADTWQKKGLKSTAERLNYLYSDQEPQEFVHPFARCQKRARSACSIQYCYRDHGVRTLRLCVP